MDTLPLVRVAAAEVYVPLLRITEPVGVGLPLPPLTTIVTVKDLAVVILNADGVTVTVGVALVTPVSPVDPEILELYLPSPA